MSSNHRDSLPPVALTPQDVEREVLRLFDAGDGTLRVRVLAEDQSAEARTEAFRELLESLAMYDTHTQRPEELRVSTPDAETLTRALQVLSKPHVERRLLERVLWILGQRVVNPLGAFFDAAPGGALLRRMKAVRAALLGEIDELGLTAETKKILVGDLRELLSDDYLTMLAEHEETVQRPRVENLARQSLRLIGVTFKSAFRQWEHHARVLAAAVARRLDAQVALRDNPVVIRDRIIEAIEDFLWVETSNELSGSLEQILQGREFSGLVDAETRIVVDRKVYRELAEACWELISEAC